nr:hypothetical protein [Tanacetum cinerariifolium]
MSDNIPFEIQLEIIRRLNVKKLLQFRAVSKQWKSLIDDPKFIKKLPRQSPKSPTSSTCILFRAIRKSVRIEILVPQAGYIVVGFGISHDTSDPKLVKIYVDKLSSLWVVVSDKFGEVSLPERLVHAPDLNVTKVNESLGLLEYHEEGGMTVCGVWSRKDGANNMFTKIYTIKVEGITFDSVLGFRNTGEVVMELQDADNYDDSSIGVYEPLSGHIYFVGEVIYGNTTFA